MTAHIGTSEIRQHALADLGRALRFELVAEHCADSRCLGVELFCLCRRRRSVTILPLPTTPLTAPKRTWRAPLGWQIGQPIGQTGVFLRPDGDISNCQQSLLCSAWKRTAGGSRNSQDVAWHDWHVRDLAGSSHFYLFSLSLLRVYAT